MVKDRKTAGRQNLGPVGPFRHASQEAHVAIAAGSVRQSVLR
jgi:hypothetical protein